MVNGARQFRLVINTLRKIGGSGDSNLVELDSLPTEESEVVCGVTVMWTFGVLCFWIRFFKR